ncbi:hypothetical protein ACFR9U_19280 [Halorientalis brevis]|uniref:DUF2795 domain-containing protein n=1 Tax=Halorientalis brevis TaxID=1126241 RepID=A0ABD6CHU1_9EURY|nr:hypothetical protein [Halorientalis brevis]
MSERNESQDDRESGVAFGEELADALDAYEYPISLEELLAEHGDASVDLVDGSEPLREILGPLGEETYESKGGVRQSVLTMVDSDAVGREGYSDRGDSTDLDDESDESV